MESECFIDLLKIEKEPEIIISDIKHCDTLHLKSHIIELLSSTQREGVENLINYMIERKFFEKPASIKFHSTEEGGLAKHSFNVYKTYKNFVNKFNFYYDY